MAPRARKQRKPRMRKGKKTGRKVAMSNMLKVDDRCVLRIVNNLVGTQSSTVPGYGSVGTFVWNAYSPQNASYFNITAFSEWNARKVLYDEFKISHMTIKYRPYTNAVQILQGLGATAANFNPDLYTFVDRNGGAPVSTSVDVPKKIQQYDSCRIHKWTKAFNRTVKVGRFWTSCAYPILLTSDNAAQPWIQKGILGFVGLYAENLQLPPGTNLGELTVEYHVQFRGKKATSFGYDPVSGSVILTPVSGYTPLAPHNPPPTVVQTLGDEVLDISGGTIVVKSSRGGEQAIKNRGQE